MEFKKLGKTGVLVSELCFGTMSFGNQADKSESQKMFNKCRDLGINFFDCADVYSAGEAESILGDLIQNCRNSVVITSKFTYKLGADVNAVGSSRLHLIHAIENSLERLRTDRIDLYFIHRFDPYTDMTQTLRALEDLVRQGKVLYIGVSNWAAWQIARALGISEKECISRFECIQPMYNLLKRQAEVELLPMALEESLAVIPYSPVAAGLLSGKYKKSNDQKGRITENMRYNKRYSKPEYYEIAANFSEYAQSRGIHPVTLAVAWVASHPAVTAPIIGARNLVQLQASLDAADLRLTPEMYNEICALSIEPDPATDRLEEKLVEKFRLRR